jgi:hypothetical protein
MPQNPKPQSLEQIAFSETFSYNKLMKNSATESLKNLETVLRKHVSKSAIEQALKDYQTWARNLKEDKKEIVHLLYFLKTTEDRSGDKTLKNNRGISEIILRKAEIPNLDRRKLEEKDYIKLVRKEINSKYQINMEFENQRGHKFNKSLPEMEQ